MTTSRALRVLAAPVVVTIEAGSQGTDPVCLLQEVAKRHQGLRDDRYSRLRCLGHLDDGVAAIRKLDYSRNLAPLLSDSDEREALPVKGMPGLTYEYELSWFPRVPRILDCFLMRWDT